MERTRAKAQAEEAIAKYLSDAGYSKEDVEGVSKSLKLQCKLARKAMLYDQMVVPKVQCCSTEEGQKHSRNGWNGFVK